MSQPSENLRQAKQCHQNGKLQQAERLYRAVMEADPANAEALFYLGLAVSGQGRHEEAAGLIREAITHQPANPLFHHHLGVLLSNLGRPDEAIDSFQHAVRLEPGYMEARSNAASILLAQGRITAAIESLQQGLELRPEFAPAHHLLGNAYRFAGQPERAVAHYRRAQDLDPEDTAAHSRLLSTLSYHVLCPPDEMLEAHREWDRRHGQVTALAHAAGGDPDRRLRIGYMSPDFRQHSVSYFMEPVIAHHDRDRVEIYCYAEIGAPDATTGRMKAAADCWRNTVGVSDRDLAGRIRADGIDVLVDLAGHTMNSRLRVFAYKPAPVQATYLGYFTTTGLSAMDYWITDEIVTPADTVERTTESIYRLPRCCLCYAPADAPAPARGTSRSPVTFGSFNTLSKISPATVALWSRVLHQVPQSTLLLKARQLSDVTLRQTLLDRFGEHGIDRARVSLLGHARSYREHMATYGEIDIALDTASRTGGTTTAEALWMGVPVVTLAGDRFIQRLSATMLEAVGLPDLVTRTEAGYVEAAARLAADPGQLAALRNGLRTRMAGSPLCDAAGLTLALETAYREMWRRHLDQPAAPRT